MYRYERKVLLVQSNNISKLFNIYLINYLVKP